MADYDVLMVSDLRLTGGTTASMAEEIRAQAAAGYRTALLHVDSPVADHMRGVSAHLAPLVDEGLAELVLAGDEVHARHAIVRHPAVAEHLSAPPRSVTADGVSLIANYAVHATSGEPRYDPVVAVARLAEWFGRPVTLRPIGPVVRAQLAAYPDVEPAAADWPGLIDVERWAVAGREAGVRGRPVIGRHTRPDPEKWPVSAADLLAAYPDGDDVLVRILGGADPVHSVLGRIPERWVVEPYGSRDPAGFLADVDFFVYYHDPRWIEAFGRVVLEALASGAVAILPEYFRETFGDAAVYARPADVQAVVTELTADRDAYRSQSKVGQDFVAARHGPRVHVDRLAELIGPPAGGTGAALSAASTAPVAPRLAAAAGRTATVPGPAGANAARVLFISSNGTGMGHLTRLLAMATRAGERIEPFFFSMSSAVPVVAKFGFGWEYCPSRDDLDVPASEWNPFFAKRFTEVVRRFHPRALVFDGTWPYQGLGEAKALFPDLQYVWSRRSMWHEGHRTDSLAKVGWFDLIIEPGEFAAEFDRGPTAGRTDAQQVGPMTLLDRADLLEREQARAELGMDPDEFAVLVTLGAGNSHDIGPDLAAITAAAGRRPDWQVYTTQPAISRRTVNGERRVRSISTFPLSRYLQAFDVGVVACGYNTYHEALLAALPSVFVPQPKVTDDQYGRARYAEHVGAGLCVENVTDAAVGDAFDRLADPAERERLRSRCLDLYPDNGAAQAMGLVEQLLTRREVIT